MNLQTVLHPEILLGTRGDPETIAIYKSQMEQLKYVNGKVEYCSRYMVDLAKIDRNTFEHLIICKNFLQFNGKTFYIPKDFGQALSTVDNDLPVSALPEQFIGYFQLAPGTVFDDTGEVEGGYVYIGSPRNVVVKEDYKKIICVSYINKMDKNTKFPVINRFCVPLTGERIGSLSKENLTRDIGPEGFVRTYMNDQKLIDARAPTWRVLVNAAIYVHTENPELVRRVPIKSLPKSKRDEQRSKHEVQNHCTLPVTLVNWNFHRPKNFSVDSTTVKGHIRWQPCGPGRQQVKLIWIDEHERHYNKTQESA